MKNKIKGSLYLLLGTTIWGSSFVAQSMGMDHLGPFAFQTVRCLLAVIGLLPVILLADRRLSDGKTFLSRWADKTLWKAAIFCGIPLFFATSFQQLGLISVDAGKAAFLTAMYIVLVPILGLFAGRKLSPMVPVSVGIAVIGLYLLSCVGVSAVGIGDLYLWGSALLFAVQITVIDRFGGSVDCLRMNCLQSLLVALASCAVMLFTEEPTWQGILDCWLPLCHAGFLSMGVAYTLQILGQRNLEPAPAALIMSLESVFAALFGWLILKETMTSAETLGSVLMFSAVILSQIPVPLKRRK